MLIHLSVDPEIHFILSVAQRQNLVKTEADPA